MRTGPEPRRADSGKLDGRAAHRAAPDAGVFLPSMSNDSRDSLIPANPSTPCVGVCRLDARGYCEGCLRTGDEIARWRGMPDEERLRLMRDVLPARKAP
jgi:predicted Fe-S protein YdhL (DUF1289 family)